MILLEELKVYQLAMEIGELIFNYKENKNFCWYARGSLFETKTANQKAYNRKLITDEEYNSILSKLKECHLLLNGYIKSIGKNNLGQNDQ